MSYQGGGLVPINGNEVAVAHSESFLVVFVRRTLRVLLLLGNKIDEQRDLSGESYQ
jgi:hypothetical protein